MCASLLSLWKHVVLIESIIFCMDPIGRDAPSRMTTREAPSRRTAQIVQSYV